MTSGSVLYGAYVVPAVLKYLGQSTKFALRGVTCGLRSLKTSRLLAVRNFQLATLITRPSMRSRRGGHPGVCCSY